MSEDEFEGMAVVPGFASPAKMGQRPSEAGLGRPLLTLVVEFPFLPLVVRIRLEHLGRLSGFQESINRSETKGPIRTSKFG